jgi:hypothetical protein
MTGWGDWAILAIAPLAVMYFTALLKWIKHPEIRVYPDRFDVTLIRVTPHHGRSVTLVHVHRATHRERPHEPKPMTLQRCPTRSIAEHAAHVLSERHPDKLSTATGRILRSELSNLEMRRTLFGRVNVFYKE